MTKQEKYLEGAHRKLEEAALNYARVQANACYVNSLGELVMLSHDEKETHSLYWSQAMMAAAKMLLIEVSMTPLPPRSSSHAEATT